jgi:hypothetical protein
MELKDLKGNPVNPRTITDEKLEALAKSLKAFGDLSGFVFNIRSGQLAGGHQRHKVMPAEAQIFSQKLDVPDPQGTIAWGYVMHEGTRFQYREVDWPEEKELAANLAANKHGGDWHYPKLTEIILKLDAMNYDLDLTGFLPPDLSNIFSAGQDVTGAIDLTNENFSGKCTCPRCGFEFDKSVSKEEYEKPTE